MKNFTKTERELAYRLAAKYIYAAEQRGDLAARDNDAEDFLDTPVWGLEAAIAEAYRMGLEAGKQK